MYAKRPICTYTDCCMYVSCRVYVSFRGLFSYVCVSFHISWSLVIYIGLFSNINKAFGRRFLWHMRSTKSGVYTSFFEVSFDMYWSLFTYKQGIGPSHPLTHAHVGLFSYMWVCFQKYIGLF